MKAGEKSLRCLVDKWLGPTATIPARVTRFIHTRSEARCYVLVETARPTGVLAIFFFRHADGSWCVFPPEIKRPSMSTG
ncbi:MAG: hypothetical protein JWR14_7539 [Caballeronia sp.]|jgi:hypothetical protein|nr:hypothetical protein [Caballeronia sp.]MDB5837709.1 hypothetical protein [Caballeronia sp.]